MADENNRVGDILSALSNTVNDQNAKQQKTLDEINSSLRLLVNNARNMSVSNAISSYSDESASFYRRRSGSSMATGRLVKDILDGVDTKTIAKTITRQVKSDVSTKVDGIITGFLDGLEDGLMDGLGATKFKDTVSKLLGKIAKEMGAPNASSIPRAIGNELIGRLLNNTVGGSAVKDWAENAGKSATSRLVSLYQQGKRASTSSTDRGRAVDGLLNVGRTAWDAAGNLPYVGGAQRRLDSLGRNFAQRVSGMYDAGHNAYISQFYSGGATGVNSLIQTITGGSVEAGAALSGLTSIVTTLGPEMLIAVAGVKLLSLGVKKAAENVKKAVQPAIDATKQFTETLRKTADSYYEKRDKKLDESQKRLMADVETLVKTPFELLNKGAQAWYDAWDSNLRTITATQGYTKTDVQDLLASFASRLREEGLTNVISAADLTTNLGKVLESGLSGTVAEEFAYLATKLNAAIPTQDFFSYAGTYASVAANAIKSGMSQADAIEYANKQLNQFASNLLYASRDLAGGFTTGLKDAEGIFQKSVQIAQAARTGDISQISGVLSSVSAITGAIAPDLAPGLVDAIYKAATGGNSSDIVALRSLAGVNASNTEFLRAFVQNPKQVFSNLFTQLSNMQAMSPDAYMEVAEGLASVFGISMDSLSRVDFKYLADAVSSMAVNSRSLEENIALLASGETTTETEQLKMQQINKMILDEGLSYVLDNEAARAIQQHMWDEQIAMQLTESTYAVELEGSSLKFIEGISRTVDNILNAVNPIRLLTKGISKLINVVSAYNDVDDMTADIRQVLEAGKVGSGNKQILRNLLTTGTNLNLTDPLATMLGMQAEYNGKHTVRDFFNQIANPFTSGWDAFNSLFGRGASESRNGNFSKKFNSGGASLYSWGTVGKSAAKALASTYDPGMYGAAVYSGGTATEQAVVRQTANIQAMLDSMQDYVAANKSYEEYVSESTKKYNLASFAKTLEDVGVTEEAARAQYDMLIGQVAAQDKAAREKREEDFWTFSQEYLNSGNLTREAMQSQNDLMIASLAEQTGWLERLFEKTADIHIQIVAFYDQWVDYFVNHSIYSKSYNHESVSEIQRKEKAGSEDAVYALAEALTKNNVDLLDPTMQTNVLLSEILKVANALLVKQGATGGGLSLPDTIAGLSLGVVNRV